MTAQKLSSHEARDTSRLSEHLLPLQVVSASKSVGTTNRSRPTNHHLGRKLEQKLTRSSRRNPCACGRTKDQDCAFNDATVFCHNSPLPDQFPWHGQTWFLHRTNCGHTGACKLFKPWPPADQRRKHRPTPKRHVSTRWRRLLPQFIAEWREAMACPEFELCSPDELRHYFKAIYRVEYNGDQLLPLLVDAARHNAKYRRFVIAVQHKLKTLRYQRRDVDCFRKNDLGCPELNGWLS